MYVERKYKKSITMEEKLDIILNKNLAIRLMSSQNKIILKKMLKNSFFSLFQETIEQEMPEKKVCSRYCMTTEYPDDPEEECNCGSVQYNEALDKFKSNLLKAIGKEA